MAPPLRSLDEFTEALDLERKAMLKYANRPEFFETESYGKLLFLAEEYLKRARSDYTDSDQEGSRKNLLKAVNVALLGWQTYNEE